LIAGTLIIYRQLNYMMNQDIGMNIDQVLVVERPGISPRDRQAFNSSVDVFRTELKRNGSITGVASSVTIPGKQREYKAGVKKYGAPDDQLLAVRFNSMDYDFIDVFKMKLVAGRGFSPDFPKDQDTSVVISESAAKLLGFVKPEDAIGQTVDVPDFQFRPIIVGVVNDYHQVSLKRAMDPTIFYCSPYYGEFYSIRIQTNNLNQTLDHVKACWEKAFPGNPIDYFYLDDFFNQQYENERKFGKLFTSFAVLAVIIGCLGLFGLSAYTAMQRTKEIGIRKVVGSSDRSIYLLLSQEYLKLIVLSILLASPIVWWFMNGWLQGFSYRMPMGVDVFLIAGIAVLLVSLITISYQTLKAIRVNPADSLRQE
jgi:putative ABC transport system permease protein